MRNRPWPIILLALFQLVMPFIVIVLASRFYSLELSRYIRTLFYLKSPFEFWMFFIAPTVASLSIFAVRRWSYPIFFACVGVSLYLDLSHWTMSATVFPTVLIILTHVFNILAVTYLLLPAVWSLYINPKFAWWRSMPRYLLSHMGQVKGTHGFSTCELRDISKGGALVESEVRYSTGDEVAVSFNYSGLPFLSRGRVAYCRDLPNGKFAYGVKFGELDKENKKTLRQIIGSLKRLQLESVPRSMRHHEGLLPWFLHLISTGNGLVPTLPRRRNRS
jgi:hypothetical protein